MHGVALVVHGLNLQPTRTATITHELSRLGYECLRLSLHGHVDIVGKAPQVDPGQARLHALRRVTYRLWRQEFHLSYTIARRWSRHQGVPLILAGYSLGALLGCIEQCEADGSAFDRMVLFSPALVVRRWCHILRPLVRFPRLVIPSLAPTSYRANPGSTMAAYGALYAALDHFHSIDQHKANIPTLLFADPEDEFLNYDRLVRLIDEIPMTNWRLHRVTKSGSAVGQYHHLTVDPEAVGSATWQTMAVAMRELLVES